MIAERPQTIAVGSGPALEAALALPAGASAGVVVCHPHPLYGGDMDSPVVMEMFRAFHHLVTDETVEPAQSLGDLRLMQGVRKFPQRVKCAMLAWRAVEQALQQSAGEATVSTETDSVAPLS